MHPRHLSESDRLALKSWNYPQILVQYGNNEIAQDNDAYFAVYDNESVFTGFGVTGPDATPSGLETVESDLDFGLGMADHLRGKRHGGAFVKAVLAQATRLAKNGSFNHLRCAIFVYEMAALRIAEQERFERSETVTLDSGEFVIMRREIK
jgi:hypothetical protein